MKRLLLLVTLSEWGGVWHIVYLLAKHLALNMRSSSPVPLAAS